MCFVGHGGYCLTLTSWLYLHYELLDKQQQKSPQGEDFLLVWPRTIWKWAERKARNVSICQPSHAWLLHIFERRARWAMGTPWTCTVYCFALTEAFRHDSAAVLGVDNPVVVFQRMHDLKYSAHPANGVVDGDCADELCCQVSVKCQLHLKEMEHIWKHINTHRLAS